MLLLFILLPLPTHSLFLSASIFTSFWMNKYNKVGSTFFLIGIHFTASYLGIRSLLKVELPRHLIKGSQPHCWSPPPPDSGFLTHVFHLERFLTKREHAIILSFPKLSTNLVPGCKFKLRLVGTRRIKSIAQISQESVMRIFSRHFVQNRQPSLIYWILLLKHNYNSQIILLKSILAF
jgi:hypothetical protein